LYRNAVTCTLLEFGLESRKDTILALNYVPGIVVQNCEEEKKNTPNADYFTFFMYTVAEGSMWKKTERNLSDWLQNTASTGCRIQRLQANHP
jgi:hypothetical protein